MLIKYNSFLSGRVLWKATTLQIKSEFIVLCNIYLNEAVVEGIAARRIVGEVIGGRAKHIAGAATGFTTEIFCVEDYMLPVAHNTRN